MLIVRVARVYSETLEDSIPLASDFFFYVPVFPGAIDAKFATDNDQGSSSLFSPLLPLKELLSLTALMV